MGDGAHPRGLFARETAGAAAAQLLLGCVYMCPSVRVHVSVCVCEIKFSLIQ